MVEVVWTSQALEDVDEIAKYIERDSPQYARITTQKIFHSVERLKQFPHSGRIIPEFGNELWREVIMGNYRIMYKLNETTVSVFTVMHGRRDVVKKVSERK
ncbi:MAG: type II toxin-antitoxin system RelE/ParE family toxin [Bacteroidota bacterium]